MKNFAKGWVAVALAGALLVACGNGDDNAATPPAADGGHDSSTPGIDASSPSGNDAGDGSTTTTACNFANFVKGLVANDTTMTALPSADLGQACTDDHDQSEFKPLFP
jgi:hypothetical protein